uniref:Neur_chan_LBD domain-containing protein n=1 Tax=Macrostomum lignano TaxID=282301 RepID=A0A1I8H4A7_9PLAT
MNSSDLITIEFGLAIIQILDLDENRQLLRTNCWLRYTWRDPLLSWDSWAGSQFENITQVRLFPYDVWTPDIRLHNFADERLLEKRMARVVVYSDGTVLWIPQALFKSTCPVEIEFFPFDTQVCFLEFGSWTYDVTQLNLTWFGFEYEQFKYEPNPYVDFTNYIKSNEWYSDGQDEFRTRPSMRSRQTRSRIRCTNRTYQAANGQLYNRTYKRLEYKIRMHRNPHFYLSILVLPCILLSCLTWVIFWLPPESPAKTQLGMNIFVAFFILLLLLAETTPSSVRTFPLIGYFYCLNMVTITLSTFLATLVINLYIRAEKQGRLHPLLRRALLEGLGRMFLIRQAYPLADKQQQQQQQQQHQEQQQSPTR